MNTEGRDEENLGKWTLVVLLKNSDCSVAHRTTKSKKIKKGREGKKRKNEWWSEYQYLGDLVQDLDSVYSTDLSRLKEP